MQKQFLKFKGDISLTATKDGIILIDSLNLKFKSKQKPTIKTISKASVRRHSKECVFEHFSTNYYQMTCDGVCFTNILCFQHIFLYTIRQMNQNYENYALRD